MLTAPVSVDGFEQFLQRDIEKELLRFTTAGSVDDGKSTLIGRLLHDAKAVYEDQLASVKKSRINRSSGPIDFSLLTDGLRAEREQGITIDVAYRHFATARRKFIIADTPGHEQYTRNMATGASTASLAVVLVDATKGLLPQTRRHSYIASLLGIPNLLVAINKMDLAGYREEVFLRLRDDFLALADQLKITAVQCVPVSALAGDNVVDRSGNMPWYVGPTLLEHLETVPIQPASSITAIRFPVQYVIRPDAGFRGFAGQVSGGTVRSGDAVMVLPSRQTSRVQSIVTFGGELDAAVLSQSVTLTLEDEIDISRGDMLVSPEAPPTVSSHFTAMVVWLNELPLELHRTYLLKHTTRQVKAAVTRIHYRVDVNNLNHESTQEVSMNGIASVELETSSPLFFDPYALSRLTGSFILVDAFSNATVGAGMIQKDLSRHLVVAAVNVTGVSDADAREVTSEERIARNGHRPAILVIPDSVAGVVEHALFERGFQTMVLRENELSPVALASLLSHLWSAAFVVLVAVNDVSTEKRWALQAAAGDSLFDFVDSANLNSKELLEQILSHAESLRVRRAGAFPGEGH
ncbi:MAG TPA: sulfate adenylyltransferase subunit CysN [Methylomirabilota bacterium]|nr:sulfate adenylyltransferase subunit CysN [Methylomirabilota bacterium]